MKVSKTVGSTTFTAEGESPLELFEELEEANRQITEAQEKQVEAERMKTAIEMAGTAAHKLNQPLTSIVCYADLLLRRIPEQNESYRALKAIADESQRMTNILRKMADITRYKTSEYVDGTKILDLEKSTKKE